MNIFNSFNIRLWLGTLISAALPYVILLPKIYNHVGHAYIISMLAVGITHFVSARSIFSLTEHPGHKSYFTVISTALLWFLISWIVLQALFLPYSLWYLGLGFILSLISCILGFRFRIRNKPILAYVPLSKAEQANLLPDVDWVRLDQPSSVLQNVNGYVVDLHNPSLSSDWQKFLAEETLKGIPVYHIRNVEEALTGRVKIHHMYENNLGSLLPSKNYMLIKHFFDVILVILSFPITLPIMLITALIIRLESPGSVLFIQNRVGQGGKEFKIYKFRSMTQDSEKDGAKMASVGDMRVTRVGKFIRKVRIDELPQFFNILKGDMSLIGPRPEQKVFVDDFEDKIPFYNYRHIVKPGISGWAQVMHGYAANADETQVKVEYDFYYIKHFSFTLDVLIFFKTIKTMLTGFGAR